MSSPGPRRPIVAVGGRGLLDPSGVFPRYLVELSGVRSPRALYLGTANGDSEAHLLTWYRVMGGIARPYDLPLFTRPDRIEPFIEEADIVFVGGGNTMNLLAIWRIHGVDRLLSEAHARGAVLAGASAGSLCWFDAGVTDSFGPALGPFDGGLGLVPGSHCPHYDSEPRRRPVYQQLVMAGTLPNGYAADDGSALVFDGPHLQEVVSWLPGATAYRVERTVDGAIAEQALPARSIA